MPFSDPRAHLRQRHLLRRNKLIATGLLLACAALLVALKTVPDPGFWVRLATAGAEASVVGGLADWFAVTALFRHPLGLPIPHTAIVPRSKDRLAKGLGRFIESHFLDSTVVTGKLASAGLAERLAHWLIAPGNADWLARRTVGVFPTLIQVVEDRNLRAFVGQVLDERLRETPVSPLVGKAFALFIASGQHETLLARLVEAGIEVIGRNQDRFEAVIGQRSGWWVPRTFDRRMAGAMADGARQLLTDLLDPASVARQRLEATLQELAADLQNSATVQSRVETLKRRLLDQPEVQAWLDMVWDRIRQAAAAEADGPDSLAVTWTAAVYRSLGETLAADAGMAARLNRLTLKMSLDVIEPTRAGVGRFIVEVVRGWDAKDLIDRLELAVGGDLQYVRLSGTVVAAIAGAGLFLATSLLGP